VARVEVAVVIERDREAVWAEVADLSRHSEWMTDAESITFRTDQMSGVGTIMDVTTRVGPFRTVDVIEVTEWVEVERIAVDHRGLVQGTGEFGLVDREDGSTLFTWSEDLAFPWYLGGGLTAMVAAPVLRRIWQQNLNRLARQLH